MSIIAIVNKTQDQGPVPLNHFDDVEVVAILVQVLPPANKQHWAIFGKVVMQNFDGDLQNASARLQVELLGSGIEPFIIDAADVRISGDSVQSVSLEGHLTLPLPNINILKARVTIICGTFKGQAGEAQFIALPVDDLHLSDGKGT